MIPRYSLPEMAAVWSDEARLAHWLEIELLAVEAWAELGQIPDEDVAACRARASFTVEAVFERERVTRHDVAAFVDVIAASIWHRSNDRVIAGCRISRKHVRNAGSPLPRS